MFSSFFFCYARSIANIFRFFLEILKSAPSLAPSSSPSPVGGISRAAELPCYFLSILSSNISLLLNFTSISRKYKVIFQLKFSTQSNFATEM